MAKVTRIREDRPVSEHTTGTPVAVDPRVVERLASIDPELLGRRLRTARLARGLTQGGLGGPDASTAYVSRIEAGTRRPSAALLVALAERAGAALDDLLRAPEDDPAHADHRLQLDYVELALETGEGTEAVGQARAVLEALTTDSPLRERATHLLGRALESVGRLGEAVAVLEPLAGGTGPYALRSMIAVCRCLRESGDLVRAVDEGEAALDRLRHGPLWGTDETVQLVATVAACHFENGDVAMATRLCREAVTTAEGLGSPLARASAYWNASIVESRRNNTAGALSLAERALALLSEGRDTRNLARLRGQLGILHLRAPEPDLPAAMETLGDAESALVESSAAPADLGRVVVHLAMAHLLDGDLERAQHEAERASEIVGDEAPLAAAEALAVRGQVAVLHGERERAQALCAEAARTLSAVGADRSTAQVWYELAGCFEAVGASAEALDAYRRAAACTGLSAPPAVTRAPQRLRSGA